MIMIKVICIAHVSSITALKQCTYKHEWLYRCKPILSTTCKYGQSKCYLDKCVFIWALNAGTDGYVLTLDGRGFQRTRAVQEKSCCEVT